MQIDWFTFGAQIVNFLILVALLKKFLYRPILNAMQEREANIALRLEEADRKSEEAAKAAAEYAAKMQHLESTREDLLAEASRDVDQWREDSLRQARHDVDETRTEWQKALQRERRQFLGELRERAVRQVHAITRQTLLNLADSSLEERVTAVFLEYLQQLDADQLTKFRRVVVDHPGPVTIRSAFPLSDEAQATIRQTLSETFHSQLSTDYEVAPDLICGIELTAGDHKLSWNIDEYLENLEQTFSIALEHELPAWN